MEHLNLSGMTPMMQQYLTIKHSYHEHLLLYRLGDFYELFFDDAITTARELNIVLTKRGKNNGEDIPMCGIPYHAADIYMQRLLNSGYSIAVCEQMESPAEAKKRGSKSVVRREVTRIITPGTIIDDAFLRDEGNVYLASVFHSAGVCAIAWADISTGEFAVTRVDLVSLWSEMTRIAPRELIVSDDFLQISECASKLAEMDVVVTRRPNAIFNAFRAHSNLLKYYDIQSLAGMSNFAKDEVIAAGTLLEYIEHTQKSNPPKISHLKKVEAADFMLIDNATRNNLEIMKSSVGSRAHSLYSVLNLTKTPLGARLLSKHLSSPLVNAYAISSRLDNVEFMFNNCDLRKVLSKHLSNVGDIERSMGRISARRGAYKDLNMIKTGIGAMYDIAEIMHDVELPPGLSAFCKQIVMTNDVFNELCRAVKDDDQINDGESPIREGYSEQLDALYNSSTNIDAEIDALKDKYKRITGIHNLKIGKNNIVGYYIEVNQAYAEKMSADIFKHKQSLSSSIRFITDDLLAIEARLLAKKDRIDNLEKEIIDHLFNLVNDHFDEISIACFGIANIDVIVALAEIAKQNNYVRPEVTDGVEFEVVNGRHPVVESRVQGNFIANSCFLHEERNLNILTGPNMAGKSTFMRQNAMICIMAQMGSFVSAERAKIGIVDKLFSRIGASDNISTGLSTFMVEMVETSYIMHNATSRSFIILDEVGRGTSTRDGFAIACAVIEYVHHELKARTLFATHYHEIAQLAAQLERCYCQTMKVGEWDGKIVLMHEVIDGIADQSYGIHVAELAGMPQSVIQRASEKLREM